MLSNRRSVSAYNMAQLEAGRSLASCPEAYSQSLKSFYASSDRGIGNFTLKCLEENVVPVLSGILKDLEGPHSLFRILSVGSGEGGNDLPFIEMLSKALRGKEIKPQFFERAIEPDKIKLESFRAKAEDLVERLKSTKNRADIEFEWFPMTYQEYVEQKRKDDIKFDMVHFIYSIYYVDIDTALKHCYEKELGPKGVIISLVKDENTPYVRYGKEFSSHGLILDPGAYYSNKDVTDVARKNGWKYMDCPGEHSSYDITAIFDRSSVEGNLVLDFLTHWINVGETVGQENLQKILSFWENECIVDKSERKMIHLQGRVVIIFKGL